VGTQIFEAFLKSEFSDENLEFWIVCEDYKKIKSSFRMSSRAKKIFKRYIQAEAPREVCTELVTIQTEFQSTKQSTAALIFIRSHQFSSDSRSTSIKRPGSSSGGT